MFFVKAEFNPGQAADTQHIEQGTQSLVIDDRFYPFIVGPALPFFHFPGDGPGTRVVGADVRGRVGQRHGASGAAVIGRLLQAFHFEDELIHFRPFFNNAARTVRNNIADTLTVGYHAYQVQNGIVVAPGDVASVKVGQGYDSLLVAFYNGADEVACGNSVKSQLIAELISRENRREVVNADIGAEHGAGLVFGPLDHRTGVFPEHCFSV
ncbi:hypothetical protein ES703_72139 [subsurface metagenome]